VAGLPAVSGTARLFLAVWPGPAARGATLALRDSWHWNATARLMRPDQLHLSLHFIGAVPRSRLPALIDGLRVPFTPFDVVLDRPGQWAHGIAVLQPGVLPSGLLQLHASLQQALQQLGLPVETRAYKPHVTLARRAESASPPETITPLRWRARSYALAESVAGPPRRYRVLQRYGPESRAAS